MNGYSWSCAQAYGPEEVQCDLSRADLLYTRSHRAAMIAEVSVKATQPRCMAGRSGTRRYVYMGRFPRGMGASSAGVFPHALVVPIEMDRQVLVELQWD